MPTVRVFSVILFDVVHKIIIDTIIFLRIINDRLSRIYLRTTTLTDIQLEVKMKFIE